jgi:hypothetical protein
MVLRHRQWQRLCLSRTATANSDVKEIDPPVSVRSTHKKRRRRYPSEPIDRRFCRSSPRNKKGNEDSTDISASVPPAEYLIISPKDRRKKLAGVRRKAITHDYVVINSIICYHILLHVLRLYSNEQSPETLSFYSTKTLVSTRVRVFIVLSSRPEFCRLVPEPGSHHRYGVAVAFEEAADWSWLRRGEGPAVAFTATSSWSLP